MNHLGTKTLESDRLLLRKFRIEDAQAMYNNWASNPEVTKYLTWPYHTNIEITKNVLSDWINRYHENDYYHWAIILKGNDNLPVGAICVVKNNDTTKMVHVGYCIGRKWWHQGIATEAFNRVISYLFNEVKVNRIESRHDLRNPNSGKVMMKCGLKYEGTHRAADWNNQGICDVVNYAILAEDYFV